MRQPGGLRRTPPDAPPALPMDGNGGRDARRDHPACQSAIGGKEVNDESEGNHLDVDGRMVPAFCRNRNNRASQVWKCCRDNRLVAYPAMVHQQPTYYQKRAGMPKGNR